MVVVEFLEAQKIVGLEVSLSACYNGHKAKFLTSCPRS
jgi:hypothetical protein